MFVLHLQIEFMARGLKLMCCKDLQGAMRRASALAGSAAAAPGNAMRYPIPRPPSNIRIDANFAPSFFKLSLN